MGWWTFRKLDRVWSGPGRDGTPGYEPDTYPALIELMEINELAYRPRVPRQKIGEGHLLLVTQMVEDMPKHDVEKTWQAISPRDRGGDRAGDRVPQGG